MTNVSHIFVNLAVADLERAKRFYTSLGFTLNEKFTNDQAAALEISDVIHAMLHTPDSLKRFTSKDLADTKRTSEVLLALGVQSREQVDDLADKALAAGGKEHRDPADHGYMYERAFEDPDGHIWEVMYMDISQLPW